MGRIYFKELPLFHLYDSDLAGTQKLLMTLLLVDRYDIYELSCLAPPPPSEEHIARRFSSGFRENRIFHHTAKQVFGNANLLRCFHHKNWGGFYEHQK